MKIFKYTFLIPQLIVENGELMECGTKEEEYTFTLLFKGVDLYEKLSGRALLSDLAGMSNLDQNNFAKELDINIIKNLAKASYCKIDGEAFHQNLVTAEEFSKTSAFMQVATDTEFMAELLNMAVECCISKTQKASNVPPKK